jgi:flagellin
MGFRINTNVAAMNAHMHSVNNNVGLNKSLSALSSGHRINKAADDAAGLSIANKLSAQAEGLGQAIRNSNDAIGLIQTADGALEEYGNILKRVRTLATQAANDTQSTASRAAISDEITALMEEANDIAKTTRFNGIKLLDGSHNSGQFTFHTGAYANETQSVTIDNAQVGTLSGTSTYTVDTQTNAEATISNMDIAIAAVDKLRSKLGAQQNKLESTVRNISVTRVNVTAAESQIRDVDFAEESANLQKHNILAQSGTYAMSQANSVQQNVMRLLQ